MESLQDTDGGRERLNRRCCFAFLLGMEINSQTRGHQQTTFTHTHTHSGTPHTCVCSKKRWVKVWKHFWFIKNLKSSKCFQTRARCLWNWSSFFIWTGNICNCIWIECATVCVSVCVPQFHLKSFKVPNEMMLRVLWACTEELNESSLPTTSA